MAFTITENFVKSFASTLYLTAAQKRSLFRDCVRIEMNVVGRMKSFDRLASGDVEEDVTQHGDTPLHDLVHSRRWAILRDYIFSPMIDDEDKLKMIIDPTSEYTVRCAEAHERRVDDTVIAAFYAAAVTGENFDGSETFTNQLASGSTGMTPTKLRSAMETLVAANVMMDEEFYLALAPKQVYTDLLNFPELTNNDYNTVRTLVDAKIGSFMGFKFVVTNRLPTNGSSERRCFAWAKSGMGLAIAKDKTADVVRRPDKKNNAQIISKSSLGAVRVEMAKVVEIPCTE